MKVRYGRNPCQQLPNTDDCLRISISARCEIRPLFSNVLLVLALRARLSMNCAEFCFKFGVGRRIPPPIWSRILITSLDAGIRWLMRDRRCDYFQSSSMNFILADLPCRQTWPPNNRVKVLTLSNRQKKKIRDQDFCKILQK